MSKSEISSKFDEIVDFAEIERFLDTPVKRYSSGMYVRLAFAVAAHLEPEILVLDEVLAVGDFKFQQKCFGKMAAVGKQGKTIILVSHQMSAVIKLCSQAVLLDKGRILSSGKTQDTIDYYLTQFSYNYQSDVKHVTQDQKEIFISEVIPFKVNGEKSSTYFHNEPIIIQISSEINEWVDDTVLGFYVRDHQERKIFTSNNNLWENMKPQKGLVVSSVTIPANLLVPGTYFITPAISIHHKRTIDIVYNALTLTILDGGSCFSSYEGSDYGCVFANCEWNVSA